MRRTGAFKLKIGLLAVLLVLCVCCKKKDPANGPEDPSAVFDKQAMLVNLADHVILPCYSEFKVSLDSLSQSYTTFKSSETLADFQVVKQKLHTAYLKYQRVNLFGFGPGEDLGIRTNFNVFPANRSTVESNISSGTYDLSSLSNIATKGFPALDYLFYGLNQTEAEQLQLFASDDKRKKYVSDLLEEMTFKLNAVITTWNTSYRATFVNSLGTDVGSSIGFLVNQINYELDYLKNAKLGIPLGLKSGGTILPDKCEAYYSGQSVQYAIETLNALENTYLGRGLSGSDGKGFDDYLDHLNIRHTDVSLNAAIKTQFHIARTKLNTLANPLSEQVVSNWTNVNNAYKELVKLLVLLKTDMPSNLGVVITYQDGDGD